jgi:2-methylisocitrate lyase-like PEP mutase family enzyme
MIRMAASSAHEVTQSTTPGQRLRSLLEPSKSIIVAPGVYDGFSARIALELGFQCLYMVGGGTECKLPTLTNAVTRQVLAHVPPNLVSPISVLLP